MIAASTIAAISSVALIIGGIVLVEAEHDAAGWLCAIVGAGVGIVTLGLRL